MLVLPASVVVFDLDGTLTEPLLDFAAIRSDMGLPQGVPILEAMARLDLAAQARAQVVLDDHESRAAVRARPAPGALDLIARLQSDRIPWGILTRNSRASLDLVTRFFNLRPHTAVSRDDAPPKPDPRSMSAVLHGIGLPSPHPRTVWMVGDGHHDLEVAVASGVGGILVGPASSARGVRYDHRVESLTALGFAPPDSVE